MTESLAESVGSSPSDVIVKWFDQHFQLTDGAFTKTKSAHEKRFMTVINLETLFEHYRITALTMGYHIPDKFSFAYTLQTKRGVRYKFCKNRWVGAIKRAANVCAKKDSGGPGDAILMYKHLQQQARAIQSVAPDAPAVLDAAALFEKFRHTV
jgi:hypothetical protein